MKNPISLEDINRAHRELSNWGRWGNEDQIGTLNLVTPERVAAAARLSLQGTVFALGASLKWPLQAGAFTGRWNAIHSYMRDGADICANHAIQQNQYTDDAIHMPLQCSTHWDALCHVFHCGEAYNGGQARDFGSTGPTNLGIEKTAGKMVGRGVLLDVARFKRVAHLPFGYEITNDDLDKCAREQGVNVGAGDFVIIRTGYQEKFLSEGNWVGHSDSAAPGVAFENCRWLKERDVAGIASDTYAVEVVPNGAAGYNFPWHAVAIPSIGVTVGEMLYLKDLAEDCARDRVFEFFFCAPALNLPGGTGSPTNPYAIK